jgi:hypothetical protein
MLKTNKMKTFYHSESVSWSSNPAKGKPHGRRNTVTIKNGKGVKQAITLNAAGNPVRRKTVKLSRNEARNVLKGKFMPGFWANCKTGKCLQSK